MQQILITGANRGLGLEFVQQYASDNCRIIATTRHPSEAQALQALAQHYPNIQIEALDVGDQKSIKRLADKLKHSAIDLLINNAGILSGNPKARSATDGDASQDFGTLDVEAWDKVLRINTLAPIMIIQSFMSHLIRGKVRKVINVTSRMGSISEMGSGFIAYRTSKAALNAAMSVIAHDLKVENIIIVNMHPGWVKTDMGGQGATLEPQASILGMRQVIAGLTLKDTGQFMSYDGKVIAW